MNGYGMDRESEKEWDWRKKGKLKLDVVKMVTDCDGQ